jgi:predicted neutral ceramidase superfamily lipid hydrolase
MHFTYHCGKEGALFFSMESIARWFLNALQVIIFIALILVWVLPIRLEEPLVSALGLIVAFGFVSFFRFLFLGNGEIESRWGVISGALAFVVLVPAFFTALFIK